MAESSPTAEEQEARLRDWARFADGVQPHRAELYRYCRRLTRNIWDAEDLMHDVLLRVFERKRGEVETLRHPRAYLFRTATHLWIDVVRRRSRERLEEEIEDERRFPVSADPVAARDAGRTLFEKLAPQERAAVLLKDVFGLSLREVAEVLGTTEGAVKAAIHRGRGRLAESEERSSRPSPSTETLDRFVAAFNALDLTTLTSLLLDPIEMEGGFEPTVQSLEFATSERGWLLKTLYGHEPDALETRVSARNQRIELARYEGEPIVAVWRVIDGTEAVQEFWHLETQGSCVSRIRDFCFSPEIQAELAAHLGLPLHPPRHRAPNEMLAQDLVVERRASTRR